MSLAKIMTAARNLISYENYMLCVGLMGHSIFVLQTYKILYNQSSNNVSLLGFSISGLSVASWLIYGLIKHDKVLIRVNVFGLVAAIVCIASIIAMD